MSKTKRELYVEMLERMLESGRIELNRCSTARDRRYVEASISRLQKQLDAAKVA